MGVLKCVLALGLHEHTVHAGDLADIPCRKVLIEVLIVEEHVIHARDLHGGQNLYTSPPPHPFRGGGLSY